MRSNVENSAYDFSFTSLYDDQSLALSVFKGYPILLVNVASACGFTPQYAELEHLYQCYKSKGLVIIGVPCNDFGGQEPANHADIANFCSVRYGVTFPMTTKEHVLGHEAHPFYIWAKQSLGWMAAPKWNFHKYLIDARGHLADYFYSTTSPQNKRLVKAIEQACAKR